MKPMVTEIIRVFIGTLVSLVPFARSPAVPMVSRATLLAIVCLFMLANSVTTLPYISGGWEFNEYGLSAMLAQLAVLLAFAYILRVWGTPLRNIFANLVALLIIYTVLGMGLSQAVFLVYRSNPNLPVWTFWTPFGLLLICILVGAFRLGRSHGAQAPLRIGSMSAIAVLAGLLFVPSTPLIYTYGATAARIDVWYFAELLLQKPEQPSQNNAYADSTDWERILANQTIQVQAELDATPKADSVPNLHFIGMAPYSSQSVFLRELTATRDIVDMHFKTKTRSHLLINADTTMFSYPLATATNLQQLSVGLKSKVDAANDIVMLFVTSHGSPDLLSVQHYPLPLNQLTPAHIKAALDATGAKHRVVILSACYSGSFIDNLKDDHTAILTASRDDRTSFGCSNERDWTYFTNALFNHAFRKTRSLQQAFDMASELVAGWEKEQKLTASEPQIYIGKELAQQWKVLMQDFDMTTSAPMNSAESASLN